MALIALFAGTRAETPADIQRGFNALYGKGVEHKPFYSQLSKRQFADFMRAVTDQVLDTLVVRMLGFCSEGPFSEFKRVPMQDGSSFAT